MNKQQINKLIARLLDDPKGDKPLVRDRDVTRKITESYADNKTEQAIKGLNNGKNYIEHVGEPLHALHAMKSLQKQGFVPHSYSHDRINFKHPDKKGITLLHNNKKVEGYQVFEG